MRSLYRILKTSEFRLSLLYAVIFSVIAAIALISVYKVAEKQIHGQVDTRLKLETNLLLEKYKNKAVEGLVDSINFYNEGEGRPFYIYSLIHRSNLDITRLIPPDKQIKSSNQFFVSILLGDIVEYVPARKKDDKVRILLTILPGGYQLLVGAELSETQYLLSKLLQATFLAISIILTLSIVIGSLMARRMVHRISAVTKTADNIISGDLSQRIPVALDNNSELDRLSLSLNKMLDRNEVLMNSMQEVTNNLAHDLRNPLNRIRNRLEYTQLKRLSDDDCAKVIEDTISDIDGVIATFNALLNIAQIESGAPRKNWKMFYLNNLFNDLADIYESVALEKNIEWQYSTENELEFTGNIQLLAQLFTNILDNAFKFTPVGGKISLTAVKIQRNEDNKPSIEVVISDSGIGIPIDKREQVFKRFHRLEGARSTEGNGLGLSLVKAVSELHDAKIYLEDNKPGLSVRVIF